MALISTVIDVAKNFRDEKYPYWNPDARRYQWNCLCGALKMVSLTGAQYGWNN